MAINNPYVPGDPYSYDLKWMVAELKKAIDLYQPLHDEFEEVKGEFSDLQGDFQDLKDFIENYFDNLDLSQEVSDKINQMVADGFFDDLIAQIVSDSGDIQTTVTTWLADNVTPVGSAVTVDTSLTIAGSAADSKTVGDRFGEVSEGNFLEFIEKINVVCGNYITGYYVEYNSGNVVPNATWGYYEKIPIQGGQFYNAKGSNWHIAFFTDAGVYISGVANSTASFKAPASAAYLTYSMPQSANTDQWIMRSTDQDLAYVSNDKGKLSPDIMPKPDHFMEYFRIGRNLYNKHRTITGASFSYQDGLSRMTVLSNYHFTPDYMPCKPSTVYTWNYPCIIAEYDEAHNCLNVYNRTLLTDPRTITTSATAAYLRFSVGANYWQDYMCVEGANVSNYEDFSLIERYPERIFTVKQDGSGDFTTISDAVKNTPAGAPIFIYDGVYNESVNARYKPVKLIGSGKNCILSYSGLDYDHPPIEIANGYVSNMVIMATNSGTPGQNNAYCAHIDWDQSIDGSLIFENVTFKNEVHQGVGIGLRRNFKLVFNNCHFESDASNAFYCHDWETSQAVKTGQELVLNNCTFKTTANYTPIKLQSQELETNAATVTFKNNKAVRGGSGAIIEMVLWNGRTLTNASYLGSSDWWLSEFSFNNYDSLLNY